MWIRGVVMWIRGPVDSPSWIRFHEVCSRDETSLFAQRPVRQPPSSACEFPARPIVRTPLSNHRPYKRLRQFSELLEKTPVIIPILVRYRSFGA